MQERIEREVLMKVAIPADGNRVSAHFGRCPEYIIIDVEDNEIKGREIIDNPGHSPGFLPEFLSQKGVDIIITGGMGRKAKSLFEEKNVETVVGVSGRIDDVIDRFLNDNLSGKENPCKPGGGKGYGLKKNKDYKNKQEVD